MSTSIMSKKNHERFESFLLDELKRCLGEILFICEVNLHLHVSNNFDIMYKKMFKEKCAD